MATAYNPSGDYAAAYDWALKSLLQNKAYMDEATAQDVASRGVRTSGVASIPEEQNGRAYEQAVADMTSKLALAQAQTGIDQDARNQQYQHDLQLAQLGYDFQNTLQRKKDQSAMLAGGLGLVGGGISSILARK